MIRLFDLLISIVGLLILSPLFIIIAVWIIIDSKGPVIYYQTRVGQFGNDFVLLKFRSMLMDSDLKGLITIGERDPRVTTSGYFLRKTKLDELPQLINVFKGDMSMVGPRPEVRKYVDRYTKEQFEILSVKPGITDYASIMFKDENALLSKVTDPDTYYIEFLISRKIELNMEYIRNRNIAHYFKILFKTIISVFS